MKTLFDYTCVEAEEKSGPAERCVAVYLASERGFQSYCCGCGGLVAVQELEGWLRVFCSASKCLKSACVVDMMVYDQNVPPRALAVG